MPRMVRSNVVLPPPLGPTMAMNWPGQIFSETFCRATVVAVAAADLTFRRAASGEPELALFNAGRMKTVGIRPMIVCVIRKFAQIYRVATSDCRLLKSLRGDGARNRSKPYSYVGRGD